MKIAIVGTAGGWERAPWGDPDWEIWGLNDGYRLFSPEQTCTRWFELHGDTPLTRVRRPPGHFDRIAEMACPVYYFHGLPPAPQAIRLDVERLAKQGRNYFTNTNCYQIALALDLGATEIMLCGTPLMSAREVVVERPCVAYWLALAEGRGVKVIVAHDEPMGLLRHPYRYAFEDMDERSATFDASYRVFWSLARWIPEEQYRIAAGAVDVPVGDQGGVVLDAR